MSLEREAESFGQIFKLIFKFYTIVHEFSLSRELKMVDTMKILYKIY